MADRIPNNTVRQLQQALWHVKVLWSDYDTIELLEQLWPRDFGRVEIQSRNIDNRVFGIINYCQPNALGNKFHLLKISLEEIIRNHLPKDPEHATVIKYIYHSLFN